MTTSLTAIAAACLMAGCGGGSDDVATGNPGGDAPVASVFSGVVSGTAYKAGSSTEPTLMAGHYQGAVVCADVNDNGKCDTGEASATTDTNGAFKLTMNAGTPVIADIGTSAVNTADGSKVPARIALRISKDQVAEQAATGVVISPLSSEVLRMVEASNTDYKTEKQNLALRLSTQATPVTGDQLLSDFGAKGAKPAAAVLTESNALTNRYAYATFKLDSGVKYPDALAVPGGDPELAGLAGISTATLTTNQDTRKPITFAQAQQAAFNVEGVPRYDSIFIVMLENKALSTIRNSKFAPSINAYLKEGNQLVSYFATGNPSEPNYTALGGGDDFGIADDDQWNADATGANAPRDLPLPDKTQPGLASSPFSATPSKTGVNHNAPGPNLFTALSAAGLTWRTYNESMNPGQDARTDSVGDPAVTVPDHVYAAGTIGGNTAPVGNPTLMLPMPGGLYKTKHHPGMAYQEARLLPEWKYSNRTVGGGQWDPVLLKSTRYTPPAGYDLDQLGTDLKTGNVGNLNFVVPDQCDDMHSITVNGVDSATGKAAVASDCAGAGFAPDAATNAILTRGDNYVDYLVKKIKGSELWNNPKKRVAIVLMFDEGSATSGFNSCCGWNPGNSSIAAPLTFDKAKGTYSADTSVVNYTKGNRGHGQSVFGILTNQPGAPKGMVDSDAYSHFALVRTMQDMFQIAKPEDDNTYLNRAKYTEKFIARHLLTMQEFQGSADTHFDAVRPINHAFLAPKTYMQKQATGDVAGLDPQIGPDAKQDNIWTITSK